MKYYAGGSSHGSETSYGFSNDWFVYVFKDKQSRDKFIEEEPNISVKAIKRKDVIKYATNFDLNSNKDHKPEPFTGQYWGIVDNWDNNPEGCIGQIEVCQPDDNYERFYK